MCSLAGYAQKHDIVHYEGDKATIIDVSIPFDNGDNALSTASEAKVEKYQSTKQALLDKLATQTWSSYHLLLEFLVHGIPRTKWCSTGLVYLKDTDA